MWALKMRLSGGNLADFTRSIRARKPQNWDGDVNDMPDMELGAILLNSARVAGFYEEGQAPTAEQVHALSYDETTERVAEVIQLFNFWNRRQDVSDEEKKSSS